MLQNSQLEIRITNSVLVLVKNILEGMDKLSMSFINLTHQKTKRNKTSRIYSVNEWTVRNLGIEKVWLEVFNMSQQERWYFQKLIVNWLNGAQYNFSRKVLFSSYLVCSGLWIFHQLDGSSHHNMQRLPKWYGCSTNKRKKKYISWSSNRYTDNTKCESGNWLAL